MAASIGNFEVWLTDKLMSVSEDIDTDVFVGYIIGVLDTEDSNEEKDESISGLLCGVVDPEVASDVCKSIMRQWVEHSDSCKSQEVKEDIGDKLSEMLGKQSLATVKEKKLTKEEEERKAAILAQYAQVSDGDETDEDEFGGEGEGTSRSKADSLDPLLTKNVNKEDVAKVEREAREKAKEEQEKKKEKDKQDRLAQKQKQQERKEAEKRRTQKGEKRR